MLTGTYEHSLDPKGRLFIPAKLREQLGTNIVLAQGPNNCITVYPQDDWNEMAHKIMSSPISVSIEVRRKFFNNSCETIADSQGRVLITGELRKYASLEKEAVITGNGNYLEIWSKEAWDKLNASEFDLLAALKELGL